MKSKILFSIFTVAIFFSGISIGTYSGIYFGASPTVYQLWVGAKEMRAAITLIDNDEVDNARTVLCNSIKTRVLIMDSAQPIKSQISSKQQEEIEGYVFGQFEKDKSELNAICI